MRWLAFSGLFLFAACPSTPAGSAGRVIGTNDVVLVDRLTGLDLAIGPDGGAEPALARNRYLFVTSTDTNELRVLDLSGDVACGQSRCYLPGPNPLETLSIPVLDRPTSLAVDERYDDAGVRTKGALLYATRPGGAELSIVGVEPSEFREVRRLALPAPVTALSTLMVDRSTSRIFVATFDGASSTIWELRHPSTPSELRKISTRALVSRLTAKVRVADESVVALQAVPGLAGRASGGRPFCADPAQVCLAVATRRDSGAAGSTLLFDLETLESVPLLFPGPVRGLTTSDMADPSLGELRARTPPPGAFVFGVLDEEACGSPRCGGISAVDTRGAASPRGFEVVRSEGVATQPVRWNDGLVLGVTIAAGGRVASIDAGTLDQATLPLLGTFTTSNGEIVFFDALEQRLLEQPGATSTLGPVRYAPGTRPDGTLGPYLAGPVLAEPPTRTGDTLGGFPAAAITDGALRSQELSITWRGSITPAGGLPVASATRFELPQRLAVGVVVGDSVSFSGCSGAGTVSAIADGVASVRGMEACAAPGRATIRPGTSQPFLISGSFDGVLGRAAAGETFRYRAAPAVRLPGFEPTAPLLVIPFGTDTDSAPPPVDSRWTIIVESGLTPLVSTIDVGLFGQGLNQCPITATLPGAVVYDVVRHRLFSAYPSANVVVEFDPTRTTRGPIGPNNGVFCYR
jgi:hypothetical protein